MNNFCRLYYVFCVSLIFQYLRFFWWILLHLNWFYEEIGDHSSSILDIPSIVDVDCLACRTGRQFLTEVAKLANFNLLKWWILLFFEIWFMGRVTLFFRIIPWFFNEVPIIRQLFICANNSLRIPQLFFIIITESPTSLLTYVLLRLTFRLIFWDCSLGLLTFEFFALRSLLGDCFASPFFHLLWCRV